MKHFALQNMKQSVPYRAARRTSLKKHAFVQKTKACFFMEQGTGIEPASEAWEATIIADIRTLHRGAL